MCVCVCACVCVCVCVCVCACACACVCVCVGVCVCAEYQKIYSRLGVKIMDRGESFYQPLMPLVVKDLEAKGGH